MSKKKQKEIGWIELFYGDFWAKRKKLIIAGFFIPLFVCFFIHIEFSLLIYWLRDIPFNRETLFHGTLAKIGHTNFLILSLILLGFSIFYLAYATSFQRVIESPLRETCREVFKEKKMNPRLVLVKNIAISTLLFAGKTIFFLFFKHTLCHYDFSRTRIGLPHLCISRPLFNSKHHQFRQLFTKYR